MRIRFLEIAEIELDDVVKFYNHESPRLGHEFLTEVVNALDRVARGARPRADKGRSLFLTRHHRACVRKP